LQKKKQAMTFLIFLSFSKKYYYYTRTMDQKSDGQERAADDTMSIDSCDVLPE